jgi:hypothetical protein
MELEPEKERWRNIARDWHSISLNSLETVNCTTT